MEISRFWLYLLMQADSIKDTLHYITVVSYCVLFAGVVIFGGLYCQLNFAEGDEESKGHWATISRVIKWPCRVFLIQLSLLIVTNTLLPTTRSLAVIYVLPEIVNNPAIQREAGELYTLAKQGLQRVVIGDDKNQTVIPPEANDVEVE